MCHIIMFSADQLAIPDEKYLYHCFRLILVQCQDIFIFTNTLGNLLFLGYLSYTGEQITVSGSILKFHSLRGFLHLLLQILQDRTVITIQKFQCTCHLLSVFLFAHISLAGCQTLPDMIIQAGALDSYIPGQHPVAGPQLVQLVQQFNGILHCRGTGIGTEIAGLILLHGTGKQDSGIILPHRHLDIRVRLVIL